MGDTDGLKGHPKSKFMNHKALPGRAYVPTDPEHIANVVTHALFIVPSLMGMIWMMSLSSTSLQHVSALVYGGALLALFSISTAFHSLSYCGKFGCLKEFFHIGDRAIIYIFIAASYTPWLVLKTYNGWSTSQLLWIIWIMAILGILYQYTFHEQYKWLETFFYLVIGVCPSIIIVHMEDLSGMYEVMLGGMVYVCGVVFFKCDGRIPFAHAIWHCFVSIGAVFHFCAVCKYLLGSQIAGGFEKSS